MTKPSAGYGIEEEGLEGQNNANPASDFDTHHILEIFINGNLKGYYDPSYGVVYKDLADMQTKAIAGFGIIDFSQTRTIIETDKKDGIRKQLRIFFFRTATNDKMHLKCK